jgi:hypothetical protein
MVLRGAKNRRTSRGEGSCGSRCSRLVSFSNLYMKEANAVRTIAAILDEALKATSIKERMP